jgi:5-oxoprolinase (ATP-hydrolysing) subunit A
LHIDLNVDAGEAASPKDELVELALVSLVSSVNIACGAHAGDIGTMRRMVALAQAQGLNIGAHPGYPDPANRGRQPMTLPPEVVRRLVRDQVASLTSIAEERGTRLTHVKPHGALYNQAATDRLLATAVARGVHDVDPSYRLVGLWGSCLLEEGRAAGLMVWSESFIDRAYRPDGTLVPRSEAGALITDPNLAVTQALTMLLTGFVRAADGVSRVAMQPDTLCIHADTPGVVELARRLHHALADKGIGIGDGIPRRRRGPDPHKPDAAAPAIQRVRFGSSTYPG